MACALVKRIPILRSSNCATFLPTIQVCCCHYISLTTRPNRSRPFAPNRAEPAKTRRSRRSRNMSSTRPPPTRSENMSIGLLEGGWPSAGLLTDSRHRLRRFGWARRDGPPPVAVGASGMKWFMEEGMSLFLFLFFRASPKGGRKDMTLWGGNASQFWAFCGG